jgi:hypothetical protein
MSIQKGYHMQHMAIYENMFTKKTINRSETNNRRDKSQS